MENRINTIEYLQDHSEVKQILTEDKELGFETWLNNGYEDDYIHGLYYPVTFLYQGNSIQLKRHILEMKLDYKTLNKIYRYVGSYNNLSEKLSNKELIDVVVKRALCFANGNPFIHSSHKDVNNNFVMDYRYN